MNEYVTTGQAADMIGVHPETVKRYAEAGLITGHKTPGGHYRLNRDSVENLKRTPAGSNVTVIKVGE